MKGGKEMEPRTEWKNVKRAVREKYAWPGGYPMYLIFTDGDSICIECARKEFKQICRDTKDKSGNWEALGYDINWEDTDLYCCHCNNRIESAYGDDD
jgi:hypothetical protein